MMPTKDLKYILNRDVTKEYYPWLDRDFKKGEIVFLYTKYTYGCIGPGGEAFCENEGEDPFFELPLNAVDKV